MTREEKIKGLYNLKEYLVKNPIALEGYKSLPITLIDYAIEAIEQEPCRDCISRTEAMRAITDEWVRGKHTLEGFTAVLYNLPPVIPERAESKGIDDFVAFLIRENCEGCKECEPRLSSDWKPNFACVEEGRAKWLLAMAEKYKAEKEGER